MRKLMGVALIAGLMLYPLKPGQAEMNEGPVEEQLLEIQKKLEELKKGQDTLIEGIKKLQEEHKQIRYFTHKN